jgi:hypothetical protein
MERDLTTSLANVTRYLKSKDETYYRKNERLECTRVYPKVFGLSRWRNKQEQQQQTLIEKQNKGLWRQSSLDWLTK